MLKFRRKLAALLLMAVLAALPGKTALWAAEPSDSPEAQPEVQEDSAPAAKSDMPARTDADLIAQAKIYAENDNLRLYVVDKYEYTGKAEVPVLDEGRRPVLDGNGKPVVEIKREQKIKKDSMFGLMNKKNGYIWWSSPINAVLDEAALGAQIDNLSSSLTFITGDPSTHSASTPTKTNTRTSSQGSEKYDSACSKIEQIKDGVRMTFDFKKKKGITIVMEVVLDKDSILVTIPQSGIKEERTQAGENLILTLSLLNSFGAAKEGEEGYIVVPDGSGAIINFDNKKTNAAFYSGQVYGRDFAVSQDFAPPVTEQVYLPVYGIVHKNGETGDNALVAVAEKGDENAFIKAAVSRQNKNNTQYNAAWFEFNMRTTDSYYIGTRTTKLTVYEGGGIKTGDLSVRYYPLNGDDLSYADVAMTYRDYLTEHKGLTPKAKANSASYCVSLGGGTVKTHSILGFPVDLQTAGTTYAEAKEIVENIKNAGVGEVIAVYNDFNTAGIKREVSPAVQYSPKLGGKSGYQNLANYASGNNVKIYPSLNFMAYFKSGNGYSYLLNSSKQTTKSYAAQKQYEYAFGTADDLLDAWTVLSPYYFGEVFDSLLNSLKKEGINTVSLDTASYMLYSDFSRRNPYGGNWFNRRDTAQILTEGYRKLRDSGISILAQSANAYALPYVDFITDVPLYSSNYDIFDGDIPFYEMVIHGVIPYAAKPLNKSADSDRLRLMALATGTPIHYEFLYENPSEFSDSDYNRMFYANYKGWIGKSLKEYKLFYDIIADVSDQKITGFKILSVYETETVFENGKTVYANSDTGEIKVNGVPVNFESYGLGGGIFGG